MPLTQQELMKQYFEEETLKIAELDLENHPENIKILEEKITLYESIVFEAKARAVKWHGKKREIELKNWDGKVKVKKLVDPKKSAKKIELTKLEKMVANLVSLGNADKDILDFIPEKFDRAEVWKAIRTVRGDSGPVLTEEQQQGIKEEEEAEAKAKEEALAEKAKEKKDATDNQ